MQRRLMLMRHAKSAWTSHVPTDHERPLNERGRRDAARVGKRLAKLGWVPDLVVGSDSRRTEETWERMQKRFPRARASVSRGRSTRAGRGSYGPRSRASLSTCGRCWSSVTTLAGRRRWRNSAAARCGSRRRTSCCSRERERRGARRWSAARGALPASSARSSSDGRWHGGLGSTVGNATSAGLREFTPRARAAYGSSFPPEALAERASR